MRWLVGAVWPLTATLLFASPSQAQDPGGGADSSQVAADSVQSRGTRVLLASPGGDSLGVLVPAAPLEVVGREGEWARVRLEGWVRVSSDETLTRPAPVRASSLRALRDDPERYRGVEMLWEVQFIALQQADSLRSDLNAGEWYLLARDPGGEPGFVYVVVPQHLISATRQLVPLQRITLVGRVRTGRSPLMGHPVLELVELRH